ncbi:hypothetical protein [Sporosarcina psychrophila]
MKVNFFVLIGYRKVNSLPLRDTIVEQCAGAFLLARFESFFNNWL